MKLQIESLNAVLSGITPPDSPRIESFALVSGAAALNSEPFSLQMAQPAKAQAIVTHSDLAAFLATKIGNMIQNPALEIKGGRIILTGKAKVAFIELPVRATLTLVIVKGTELHVEVENVEVAGGGAMGLLEGFIEKQNPILDTAKLPFPVTLTKVTLENNLVTVEGEALPPR